MLYEFMANHGVDVMTTVMVHPRSQWVAAVVVHAANG
jgi:hypothetical protein